MKKLVLLIFVLFLSGCSLWDKQQTLRLIHDDVPVGVKLMQSDAKDAASGTSLSYNTLSDFTRSLIKENYKRGLITQAEAESGYKYLDNEKSKFQEHQKPLTRIDLMGDEVLYGMGWEEGLRDPLVPLEAFGIGVGAGVAGAAAF